VVHVLISELRRVHKSLRANGWMLVFQPAQAEATIVLEIGGSIEFCEEFRTPNFHQYLEATITAIDNVLSERLFTIEDEATTPEKGYHWKDFGSVDEWVGNFEKACVDLDALYAMAAKMRNVARGRKHRVYDGQKEYKVLLRKFNP